MIIGSSFPGDDDRDLMFYQHNCYYDSLGLWINWAGDRLLRYRNDPEWREIYEKWLEFRQEGTYDHRTIQYHHDLIAAKFRKIMKHDPFLTTFTLQSDEWHTFFRKEAVKWLGEEQQLKLFFTALLYVNQQRGYAAEDALAKIMQEKYQLPEFDSN